MRRAAAAGATHLNLDGTLIHTGRVAMNGPAACVPWPGAAPARSVSRCARS